MCLGLISRGAGKVSYPPLLNLADEAKYRDYFETGYCQGTIQTFDGIKVRFRKSDFPHCCFESSRRDGVKDEFSIKRAKRLNWIEVALADPNSERYQGWDRKHKRYDKSRRVTLVMGNYVVVIAIKKQGFADFVTAYVADTPGKPGRLSTVERIQRSPKCA
jgi:hypothetical protein